MYKMFNYVKDVKKWNFSYICQVYQADFFTILIMLYDNDFSSTIDIYFYESFQT
jgi:hypothetical protein